jgi:NADPH2:quinone reductase
MKAVLCKQHGLPDTLVVEEIPSPKAGAKQVVITVKACGVNFPDTLIIQNKYQFKPELPFSPGGEVAGIIKEVGEGVSHLNVGDTVIAMTGWGGFAEEVLTDASRVFPVPPVFDFKTAATFAYVFGTSYHALKDRAQLKEGETVLVLGASGGVGLAAVQLAKVMGAKVIAAASTKPKNSRCVVNMAQMRLLTILMIIGVNKSKCLPKAKGLMSFTMPLAVIMPNLPYGQWHGMAVI